jgi:hypothetical protein
MRATFSPLAVAFALACAFCSGGVRARVYSGAVDVSLSEPAAMDATVGCGRLSLGATDNRSDSKAAGTSLLEPAAAGTT